MITRYESGTQEITLNKAFKLYELFGGDVFNKIDLFCLHKKREYDIKTDITKKYNTLGFDASDVKKTPFNVIARKKKEIILTEVTDRVNPNVRPLSKLIDAYNLVIFKKKKPKNLPALTKKEFLEFEESEELIKFLKEFE